MTATTNFGRGHGALDTHATRASTESSSSDHTTSDARCWHVAGTNSDRGQARDDDQRPLASVGIPFNLGKLIAEVLHNSKEADPHVIALAVSVAIPDEHLREALDSCLPERVRLQITRDRMSSSVKTSKVGPSRWASLASASPPRECVGGVWKLLADCDADDCDTLARQADERAEENRVVAAKWRRYAAHMRVVGAASFKELTEQDHENLGAAE